MNNQRRYSILIALIALYLLPTLLLSSYSLFAKNSWILFSIGLVISFVGTVILFIMMCQLEEQPQPQSEPLPEPIAPPELSLPLGPTELELQLQQNVKEWEEKHAIASQQIQEQDSLIKQHLEEKAQIEQQHLQIAKELETYRTIAEEQIQLKDRLLQESQQAAREQRVLIEKHQQHITSLESKERDLHYELKTLLQLTHFDSDESGSVPQPIVEEIPLTMSTALPETASQQLKRCLDVATKMTGSHYNANRYKDFAMDNYALDLRQLLESFRDENNYIILVYSQRENKLLFASPLVKHLLGWLPDKFVQQFQEIIQEGQETWHQGMNMLSTNHEVQIQLPLKAKSGQVVQLNCHMGAIHTGTFRHHAIAILYEPKNGS